MTTEDIEYRHAATRYVTRKQAEDRSRQQHDTQSTSAATAELLSSDESSDDDSLKDPNEIRPDNPRQNIMAPKRPLSESCEPLAKRCIIDNPSFHAALVRTRTTTRQAMMIVIQY